MIPSPYLSKMVRSELKDQYLRTLRHSEYRQAAITVLKLLDGTVHPFAWLQKAIVSSLVVVFPTLPVIPITLGPCTFRYSQAILQVLFCVGNCNDSYPCIFGFQKHEFFYLI